jgi:hypothetical protein
MISLLLTCGLQPIAFHACDIILPSRFCPAFFETPAYVLLPSSSRFAGLRCDKSVGQAVHPAPLAFPKSGAEVTAVQTLARLLIVTKTREASGLRRVYRRFQVRHGSRGLTRIESVKICEIRVIDFWN